MKLQELAAQAPAKQAAKVFESYFGKRIKLENLTGNQARGLLNRIRGLVKEHRARPEFHYSEQDHSYLKLIMLEQVLSARLAEVSTIGMGQTAGALKNQQVAAKNMPMPNTTTDAQYQNKYGREEEDQEASMANTPGDEESNQTATTKVQKVSANATAPQAESRVRRGLYYTLQESEIQQAQVVLASQDMVDQVQKMIEQVTAMQFKDLPALVDQIKNEVGIQQSTQFNADATAALSGLVQNLQGSKQQLEQALGVVTGQPQAAEIPGTVPAPDEMAMEPAPELGAEEGPDVSLPPEEEEPVPAPSRASDLGRKRR